MNDHFILWGEGFETRFIDDTYARKIAYSLVEKRDVPFLLYHSDYRPMGVITKVIRHDVDFYPAPICYIDLENKTVSLLNEDGNLGGYIL